MEAVGEALKSRALELFKCVMLTAFELLCWDEKSKLADDLSQELTDDEEVFVTMLFNDEVHTYEQVSEAVRATQVRYCVQFKMSIFCWCLQVISALQRAVKAEQKEAAQFATTVDREV